MAIYWSFPSSLNLETRGSAAWLGPHLKNDVTFYMFILPRPYLPRTPRPRSPVRPLGFKGAPDSLMSYSLKNMSYVEVKSTKIFRYPMYDFRLIFSSIWLNLMLFKSSLSAQFCPLSFSELYSGGSYSLHEIHGTFSSGTLQRKISVFM